MKTVTDTARFVLTALLSAAFLLTPGCDRKTADPEPDALEVTSEDPSVMPEVLPSSLQIKRRKQTYVITGIGMKGTSAVAIINNKVLKPGMEIDPGVFLKEVHPTYAIIVAGGKQHLIRPEDIQRELDKKKR